MRSLVPFLCHVATLIGCLFLSTRGSTGQDDRNLVVLHCAFIPLILIEAILNKNITCAHDMNLNDSIRFKGKCYYFTLIRDYIKNLIKPLKPKLV